MLLGLMTLAGKLGTGGTMGLSNGLELPKSEPKPPKRREGDAIVA